MKIELIISTVNMKNVSEKLNEMNLHEKGNDLYITIINQCDNNCIQNISDNVTVINTISKGTGNSRNKGTFNIHKDTDIVMYTDDDVIYDRSFDDNLKALFSSNKNLEVAFFNVTSLNLDRNIKPIINEHKLSVFNSLRYGMYNMAIKADVLKNSNIWFSTDFGGGSKYLTGEDSLFIYNLLKKKVKKRRLNIVAYPIELAKVNHKESTWKEKEFSIEYFIGKGALFYAMSRSKYRLYILYFALKHYKKSEFSLMRVLKIMSEGAKKYKMEDM